MSGCRNPITDYDRKPLPPSPITLVPLAEMVARIEAIRYEGEPTKRCSHCTVLKPLEDFNRRHNRQFLRRSVCRACNADRLKQRRSRLAMGEIRRAS